MVAARLYPALSLAPPPHNPPTSWAEQPRGAGKTIPGRHPWTLRAPRVTVWPIVLTQGSSKPQGSKEQDAHAIERRERTDHACRPRDADGRNTAALLVAGAAVQRNPHTG